MKNKKILNNTLMLYTRQLLIIVVTLYTMRVVLNTLGVTEFGIYSVVAGIVTLCSFLSGSMGAATQRFFSFALGKNDEILLKKTFCVNLIIYFGIGILAFLVLETIGLLFVSEYLNVPKDRISSVVTLYHYSVAAFIFSILTSPLIAIIVAHEDMKFFAGISILEALMKLTVVFILVYLPWDKLELYGLLLLGVSIVNFSVYLGVCINRYAEVQFKKFYFEKELLKNICSFTGWTLFGQISTVARNQAVTILLNQFFNPATAAARAISFAVSSQVNVFANSFNLSLYPSIIKSYATGDSKELFALILGGSKLTFFLMWIFALPLLVEMELILTIWLKTPPASAVVFTQLAILEALLVSISLPLASAARAPGKMKLYELTLGLMQLSILLISYIVLSVGYEAQSVFIVAIIVNVLMFFIRLLIVSQLIKLNKKDYLIKVAWPLFLVMILSSVLTMAASYTLPVGWQYSFITVVVSIIVSSISMYYIGLDSVWRGKINNLALKIIKR